MELNDVEHRTLLLGAGEVNILMVRNTDPVLMVWTYRVVVVDVDI